MMTEEEIHALYPGLYQKWWDIGYECGLSASERKKKEKPPLKPEELEDVEKQRKQIIGLQKTILRLEARIKEQNKIIKVGKRDQNKENKEAYRRRKLAQWNRFTNEWSKKQSRNEMCIYCGCPADTIDHLIPLSRGGSSRPENLANACRGCNQEKGNMTDKEYKTWLKFHKPL